MGVFEKIFQPLAKLIAKNVIKELDRIYFPNQENFLYPIGDTKEVLYFIYRSNGEATIEAMVKELKIGERSIRGIVKTLVELQILEVKTTEKGKKKYSIAPQYKERIRFIEKEVEETL